MCLSLVPIKLVSSASLPHTRSPPPCHGTAPGFNLGSDYWMLTIEDKRYRQRPGSCSWARCDDSPIVSFIITYPYTSRWSFLSVLNTDTLIQTHTHTHQFSLFISSEIILHKRESWKPSHFLTSHLKLSWWQFEVTTVGSELTFQLGGFPHPPLLSMKHKVPSWFLHLALPFPETSFQRSQLEDMRGVCLGRGGGGSGPIWSGGSLVKPHWKPATDFWTLPLTYYRDASPWVVCLFVFTLRSAGVPVPH